MPASPKGRRSSAVEEVVLAEIDRLRTGGITPEELKKVHAQLRARFVYDARQRHRHRAPDRLLRDDRIVVGVSRAAEPARRGHRRAGAGRGREVPDAVEPHDRLV